MLLLLLAPAYAVESFLPSIDDLAVVINKLESESLQITDMSVGIVFDDGRGYSLPISAFEGEEVIVVAMGDDRHLLDMDLWVLDGRGNTVAYDDLDDKTPVVTFIAPAEGIYELRVVVVDTVPGTDYGLFAVATAAPTALARPITVGETWVDVRSAAEALESQGFQVLHAEWETVSEGREQGVSIDLPPYDECIAVATGSGSRTRKLDLYVGDPWSTLLGFDRRHGASALVAFPASAEGQYVFVMEPRRLRRRTADTHVGLVVGCRDY